MSGQMSRDELFSETFANEVMDLCIGCKGCSRDCPSGVDLAKIKAEVEHERHQRGVIPMRDRLFANIHTVARIGSLSTPFSNYFSRFVPDMFLKAIGIDPRRGLPRFASESFIEWFETREPEITPDEATRHATIFPDTYTTFMEPGVSKAGVKALERAKVHVELPSGVTGSGRPLLSNGFIDRARGRAKQNVDVLAPRIRSGRDLVIVEPSDAVMMQTEYLDLLGGDDVELVANNAAGIMEYIDQHQLDAEYDNSASGNVIYHGHCHQHAEKTDKHSAAVLRRMGFDVETVDSTCCGMAGNFGYEEEHYELSLAIGSILFDQIDDMRGTVTAPGASCRTQLSHHLDEIPPHPIELLEETISPK
ncbi:MAG: (Fe-S)-binding protein, partial [Halobacteriaceae archaeon]